VKHDRVKASPRQRHATRTCFVLPIKVSCLQKYNENASVRCSHNISLSSTISSVRHPLLLGGTSSSAYYRMSQPLKGQLSAHCGCKRIPQPELDRTKNIIRWRQIACSAATTEPHKWPVHHVLRNFSGGPYEFPLSLHFHLEIIITTCHTINTSHL
jgi:hypothetical protein